jgi:choline dehydrogenase-like flavoprotein
LGPPPSSATQGIQANEKWYAKDGCAFNPGIHYWVGGNTKMSAGTTCDTTIRAFIAMSRQRNPTKFQKTLALNDFYFTAPDFPCPLGHIQMLGKSHGATIAAQLGSWARMIPELPFAAVANHGVDFWLTSEDLPDPDNRIIYGRDGTENNMEGHRRLQAKLKDILESLDFHPHLLPRSLYLDKNIPFGGTAHQAGTIRFGRDPNISALDLNRKAHDFDNLYVVDSSFFVSIGAVDPSLTVIANELRIGDHLLEPLGRGS